MSVAARTETGEQRGAIYAALAQRNRLIRLLRIGLPALGVIVLLGLALQIYLGSLVPDFGFANVTIDRENLVVEAPVYSGAAGDGSTFTVSAASARTSFLNTDVIALTDAIFTLTQSGGARFEARGAKARLEVADELVLVDGIAYVEGSDGLSGTVVDAEVDVGAQTMLSHGPVDLKFRNADIEAASMTYDGETGRWTFTAATLVLAETPGERVEGLRPALERTAP